MLILKCEMSLVTNSCEITEIQGRLSFGFVTLLQSLRAGGYLNYFLRGCVARALKPLPISKDFLHQKMADLTVFLKFLQIGTHF